MWSFIEEFIQDSLFDLGEIAMLQKYWWMYAIPIATLAGMMVWTLWRGRAS